MAEDILTDCVKNFIATGEPEKALAALNGLKVLSVNNKKSACRLISGIVVELVIQLDTKDIKNINPSILIFLLSEFFDEDNVPKIFKDLTLIRRISNAKYEFFLSYLVEISELLGSGYAREVKLFLLALENKRTNDIHALLEAHVYSLSYLQICFIFVRNNTLCVDWLKNNVDHLVHKASKFSDFWGIFLAIYVYCSTSAVKSASDKVKELKVLPEASLKNFLKFPDKTKKVNTGNKRLSVAICVSGQLRGYEEALRTWKELNLESINVDYFVSIWSDMGRKFPTPSHAGRNFDEPFRSGFISEFAIDGPESFWVKYPNLKSLFLRDMEVDAELVAERYAPEKLEIENEDELSLSFKDNQERMYYKVEKCFNLIGSKLHDYDLVIRIRPDKAFKESKKKFDWNKVYEDCLNGIIYTDRGAFINIHGGVGCSDQIAIGTPTAINVYSSLWSKHINKEKDKLLPGEPRKLKSHVKLGFVLLKSGYFIRSIDKFASPLLKPLDPKRISNKEIYEELCKDVNEDDVRGGKLLNLACLACNS